MARKLILTFAVLLTLLSETSTALELGGIRGQSALNDPFVGEIDLLDVTPEELDTVKVELGSAEEFRKAGVDRLPLLATLQFKVKVSPGGRPIIQATSREPIREPFLDFLVEVIWTKGRLVKEYTVLLDPPVTTSRPPPPVESPAVSKSAPQSQPLLESTPLSADTPPRTDLVAQQPQNRAKLPVFPLRYGPIKPGEGLWRIALRISPSDATAAQTAMALYRNNQDAFIGGDINRLTVGDQLQIPTAAELYALDSGAAQRELSTALAGGTVTAAPLTDVTATAEPEARLEITTASPQEAAEAVEPPQERDEPVPELGVLENELLLVREAGESTRQETQELRERIHDLETQLGDIRRLLELRNEQLAQLQGLAALDLELEPSAVDKAGAPPSEEILSAPEEPTEPPDQAAAGDADVAAAGTDNDASTIQPGDGVETIGAPPEQAPAPTEPEPSVSFWDRGPWGTIPKSMLGLGLAISLLLLLLGWMILRRRRRSDEALMADSVAADFASVSTVRAADFTAADSMPASEAGELPDSAERSSHTIMSYTGFGDIEDESEEADVLSEADVYIAYGRYSEAESLLTEEIAKAPRRLDLKLKLAEAHFGVGDSAALRRLMDDIQRTAGDRITPGQWKRLTAMARDTEGSRGESGRTRESETTPPRGRSEPLSFPSGPTPSVGSESDAEQDFPPVDVPEGPMGPIDSRRSQELELSLEDLNLEDSSFHPAEKEARSVWQLRESDLELGFEDLPSPRDEDLGDLVAGEGGVEQDEAFPIGTESAGSRISLDDLNIVPAAGDSAQDDLSGRWQMDPGPWDPVATKIDLAHAYLEMEDLNAARLILEEVVAEGNEEQRAVACDMLDQLN